MASKVFLFNETTWLYCSDVTFKDGVYRGYVVNGAWDMTADTKTNTISNIHSTYTVEFTWACDANEMCRDYHVVIANAEARYEAGEPANFVVKERESIGYGVKE